MWPIDYTATPTPDNMPRVVLWSTPAEAYKLAQEVYNACRQQRDRASGHDLLKSSTMLYLESPDLESTPLHDAFFYVPRAASFLALRTLSEQRNSEDTSTTVDCINCETSLLTNFQDLLTFSLPQRDAFCCDDCLGDRETDVLSTVPKAARATSEYVSADDDYLATCHPAGLGTESSSYRFHPLTEVQQAKSVQTFYKESPLHRHLFLQAPHAIDPPVGYINHFTGLEPRSSITVLSRMSQLPLDESASSISKHIRRSAATMKAHSSSRNVELATMLASSRST